MKQAGNRQVGSAAGRRVGVITLVCVSTCALMGSSTGAARGQEAKAPQTAQKAKPLLAAPGGKTLPVARIDQPVALDYTLSEIGASKTEAGAKPATLNLAEAKGKNNLVLFFLSESCGVTFYYKSRLQRLQKDFANQGFAFVGVRGGRKEKPDAPLDLPETKYLPMPFVDDATGELIRYFKIRQSLTFAVIDRTGVLRYRGAFDDNVDARRVAKPYLRNALRSLAAGRPVAVKEVGAIGCALLPMP